MTGIAPSKEYICAVDIAKKRDYTAIQIYKNSHSIIHHPEDAARPEQIVSFLDLVYQVKMQALRYTEQARIIRELLGRVQMLHNTQLLVDGTGVGEAVVDIMREDGLNPLPIVFTSGNTVQPVYEGFGKVFGASLSTTGRLSGAQVLKEIRVPKEDLVHAGMLVMEQKRLRLAANIAHEDDFKRQMLSFRGKVNEKTGRTKYENESDDIHDDWVVTYLMACWWLTYSRASEKKDLVVQEQDASWDPFDYV
jgi:hypothetical protein